MLTVIFGAGASYDSIPPDPRTSSLMVPRKERLRLREHERDYRPPLGAQLFEPRPFFDKAVAEYRSIAILAQRLRALPNTVSLESELDTLRERARTQPGLRRELTAMRFYLKRVLWECADRWADSSPGTTNYHHLLRRLKEWRDQSGEEIAIVTFNYDLLLEHALRDSVGGLDLTTIEGYTKSAEYKILRPHGAVNWVRYVSAAIDVGPSRTQAEIEQAVIDLAETTIDLPLERFEVVANRKTYALGGRALFPLLTLPVRTKSFELPDTQRAELERALAEPSRVLVVGWRATETHFLELWKGVRKTNPLLLVVSGDGDGAARTLDVLTPIASPSDGLASVSNGFTGFLRAKELDDFLAL